MKRPPDDWHAAAGWLVILVWFVPWAVLLELVVDFAEGLAGRAGAWRADVVDRGNAWMHWCEHDEWERFPPPPRVNIDVRLVDGRVLRRVGWWREDAEPPVDWVAWRAAR